MIALNFHAAGEHDFWASIKQTFQSEQQQILECPKKSEEEKKTALKKLSQQLKNRKRQAFYNLY